MKKKFFKQFMAGLLALCMALPYTPGVSYAGDTYPYLGESAKGENQPFQHGYRAEDLLSWNPETDPYADELRARVPLQSRIQAVAATQANPSLSSDIQYLTLTGDYGNSFYDSYSYTNEFSQYLFNYWQYIDIYGSWHGMPTENTESLYNAAGERAGTSDWTQRNFEFGMINLPNAGYTNAAHKNGVLSLGCIFQPRAYQSWKTLIQQDADGTYPYAKKLIEIAQYFGFDGWFFNMEGNDRPSGTDITSLQAFLKSMRDAGLYIQWYDASSSATSSYMTSGAADSQFLDYGWTASGITSSITSLNSSGLNGIKALFGGVEAGGNRWTNTFSKFLSSGKVIASIATLGTDFVHAGLDEDLGTSDELREQDAYQWMAIKREQMWWTGSSGSPKNSAISADASVGVSTNKFPGVSQFISERSVIDGDTFVTNFNTGHGLVYGINGVISNEHEWSNINLQDILPTWQWWFETTGTAALKADFDYGTTYKKTLKDGTASSFDFTLVDPYKGGSSLAVYGTIDSSAKSFLHLYKTDLEVEAASKLSVTFKKTSSDAASMSLGVVFSDSIDTVNNTYTVTTLPVSNTTAASDGWVTATVDLSSYAGKSISVMGLVFEGEASNYQMHIGELKYTSGDDLTPAAPTGLAVTKAYDTGEMVINWDLASYDSVKQYNVYAVINGKEYYMGGIYDNVYYIKDTYDAEGSVTVKVTAVGADGSESTPAVAAYNYSAAVTNVTVNATDGNLAVSWDALGSFTGNTAVNVKVKKTGTVYTATAVNGASSVSIAVPSGAEADGADYSMTITPAGASAVHYDGELNDSYCAPYDGKMTDRKFTGPVKCSDWYTLSYTYTTTSGTTSSGSYTRGVKSHGETNNDWSAFQQLPSGISRLTVTLTDYKGNVSKPVSYVFQNDQPLALDAEIDSSYFPDEALLAIIKDKVGSTLNDVIYYSGSLDLSGSGVKDLTGLSMMSSLSSLDISGTAVTSVTDSMLPTGLTALNIRNCASLITIDLENSSLQLDFTGCTALTNLYLSGTSMTSIDITDITNLRVLYLDNSKISQIIYANPNAYTNIYNVHVENSKMDLSGNTAEGILMNAIKSQTIVPVMDTVESNVAAQATCSETKFNDGVTTTAVKVIAGDSYVFDFGSKQTLTQFNMTMSSTYYYPTGVTISVSEDGVNYTAVGTWSDLTNTNSGQNYVFSTPANGRYYKLTIDSIYNRYSSYGSSYNYGYLYEVGLMGYATEPYGIYYSGQQPVIVKDALADLTYEKDGAQYQLLDVLNTNYANARTFRGNLAANLTGADWIDASYLKNQITVSSITKVVITTDNGETYVPTNTEDPKSKLGSLITTTNAATGSTIIGYSGQTGTSESVDKMFDGDTSTKWCYGGSSGWAAITLSEAKVVGQWYSLNAGISESTDYNTKDYCLQILNTEAVGMSEDEYIAYLNTLTSSARNTALANNSIWTTISSITGNTQTEVTRDISELYSARLYRIYVTASVQGSSNVAIRLYSVELYAYEGTLGAGINGIFVADTPGEYHVSYQTNSIEIASMKVTVNPETVNVESVTLNTETLSLSENDQPVSLIPIIYPDDATNKNVTWSSSNPGVATVSESGLVTPVSAGTTTITVTTEDGGFTASCEVTVTEEATEDVSVTGVTLNTDTLTLTEGGTGVTLIPAVTPDNATNKAVSWESSNSGVAAVSQNGLVTPVSAGSATITVTTADGSFTATCEVTVNVNDTPPAPVTGVTLNTDTLTLTEGGTGVTLIPAIAPENAANKAVIWASSDEGIATVSQDGLVTPVSAGTAVITVTTVDGGFTATCEVTVAVRGNIQITGITVSGLYGATSVYVGNTLQMVAEVLPNDADNKTVTWNVINGTGSAVISANGLLMANGTGTVTVQAVAEDGSGITGEIIITIYAPVIVTPPTTVPTVTPTPTATPTPSVDENGRLVVTAELIADGNGSRNLITASEELLQQIAEKDVLSINLEVPSEEISKDSDLFLEAAILRAAKDENKSITVTVKNNENKEAYSWTFNREMLAASDRDISDVNLKLDVTLAKDSKEYADTLGENTLGSALIINFAHEGVLPAQSNIRIYVGDQQGIEPGTKVYLYHYNKETGKLETLPNSSKYTVDKDGYINVNIIHCSDYVALTGQASADMITSLRDQITVTVDRKTLSLSGGTGKAQITVKLPFTLVQVASLEDISKAGAVAGATITYTSNNKKVATVDENGTITGLKAGKAVITAKITLYSGKTKTVKFTVTVKK